MNLHKRSACHLTPKYPVTKTGRSTVWRPPPSIRRPACHQNSAESKWLLLSLRESGHQGLDCQRRTTLCPIIDEHIRALSLGHDLLNQRRGVLSHARLWGDDPVVRRISFNSFFKSEPQRRKEPDHDMGGGKCLIEQAMLLGKRRHGRPMVVHVGDVVSVKNVQVTGSKNRGIADFSRILWSWWQCAEKSVQRIKECGRLHTPALKFKNERTKF